MAHVAETLRQSVGPEFELGHWSFFPSRPILSELWSSLLTTDTNLLSMTYVRIGTYVGCSCCGGTAKDIKQMTN